MLLLECIELASELADSLTLASVVLKELTMRVLHVRCHFLQLVGPLREHLLRGLVEEPDLLVSFTLL